MDMSDDLGRLTLIFNQGDSAVVIIPVRNIGPGLAFIQSAELNGDVKGYSWRRTTDSAIPPGEIGRFKFNGTLLHPGDRPGPRSISLDVYYTDVSGGTHWQTHLLIKRPMRDDGTSLK
jgi:hypothetical protein